MTCLLLLGPSSPAAQNAPDELQWLRNDDHQKEYIDKKGIHVIVGHYMGKDLPWDPKENITEGESRSSFALEIIEAI